MENPIVQNHDLMSIKSVMHNVFTSIRVSLVLPSVSVISSFNSLGASIYEKYHADSPMPSCSICVKQVLHHTNLESI